MKKLAGVRAVFDDLIELAIGDYAGIRQEYRVRIYAEIADFLNGANVTTKKNAVKKAITDAFNETFDLGYADGGGKTQPSKEDVDWLDTRMRIEWANADALFEQLSQTRKDPDFKKSEIDDIAETRSDGYTSTLDSIYNESKMRGAGSTMLTFGGTDGHTKGFPCRECRKLKGQRHRASWWVKRGYVPYPGNPNFTCGTWQCQHFLYMDDGSLFTL